MTKKKIRIKDTTAADNPDAWDGEEYFNMTIKQFLNSDAAIFDKQWVIWEIANAFWRSYIGGNHEVSEAIQWFKDNWNDNLIEEQNDE